MGPYLCKEDLDGIRSRHEAAHNGGLSVARDMAWLSHLDREQLLTELDKRAAPVPMILTCPACGERHIDEHEFVSKPHHTHACQKCGMCWRPAVVATVGVRFLPGFKN